MLKRFQSEIPWESYGDEDGKTTIIKKNWNNLNLGGGDITSNHL